MARPAGGTPAPVAPVAEAPAAVAAVEVNVPALEKLVEDVKEAKYKRSETLETLRTTRQYHLDQVEEISKLLEELGEPLQAAAPVANGKPAKAAKPEGASKGTRGSNQYTIQEAVEELLKKKAYKAGLGRVDITGKVISEMGYKTETTGVDFANSAYTGGINKLVKDKKVYAIGKRPNTVYRHVSHMTPSEVKAADAAKAADEAQRAANKAAG